MAQLGSAGALGALGRRFESCRPDSNNPIHRQVSQPVFFIAKIMTAMKAVNLRSNIALFDKTKHAEPSKKIVIA